MSKTDALITFGATGQDQVSAAMNKVSSEVNKTATRINKGTQAMNNMTKSGNALKTQFRLIRGGAGQVGHQVQDMAVQFQGGTHAAIVLGQQGSQIASLFGPQGAIIGAFGAVGAAIYTSVNKASVEAARELKAMKDEMGETALKAGVLTEEMRELAIVKAQKNLESINEQIKQLKEGNEDALSSISKANNVNKAYNSTLESGGQAVNGLALAYLIYGGEVKDAKDTQKEFGGYLQQLTEDQKAAQDAVDKLTKGIALGKTKTDESIESIRKQISIMQLQVGGQYDAAQAQMIYNATQDEELKDKPELLAKKIKEIELLFQQKKALEGLLSPKEQVVKSTKTEITEADKLEQKLTRMNEQYGKSRVELLKLQAVHAAKGDSDLLKGLMAQIDEYAAKLKATADNKSLNLGISNDFDDFQNELDAMKDRADAVDSFLKTDVERFNSFYGDKKAALEEARDAEVGDVEKHNENLVKLDTMRNQELATMQQSTADASNQALMSQFNTLASFFDQTTGIGKAFYAVQQAMAASDAIIKGYQTGAAIRLAHANIAAMMPDPTGAAATAMIAKGEMMSNVAVGMGFATAGAIAGQTLASFEGGGITFNGVRSGGMDGKGGRMALVHPNEKITDMEKGGSTGQPVNVSFNISAVDSKGIDQLLMERRGMITSMVQKAVNNRGKRIM